MNKILKSAGLVALGALSLPTARADDGRLWGVSATVRGFYDDNYNIASTHLANGATDPSRRSSIGFDVSPYLRYDTLDTWGPSSLQASYRYDYRYYQDRADLNLRVADQSHDAIVGYGYKAETITFNANEEFVRSSLPGLSGPLTTGAAASFLRAPGNNIRNSAGVGDVWELSRILSLDSSYKNNLYSYDARGIGSYSALLDRIEHIADINLMYIEDNTLTYRFGYKFEYHDQTSHDLLGAGIPAKFRNSESHFAYVGADWKVNEELSINPRAGAEYTRYPDAAPIAAANGIPKPGTTVNPYVEAQATYKFSPEGSGVLTVKHERNQTDVGLQAGTSPTLDAESTLVTLGVNYQFLPELSGQVLGSYQYSQFRGGTANGLRDNMFSVETRGSYEFIKGKLWGEAGYVYTRLDSELNFIAPRSFYRNQIYFGVKASF